jgi:hypothetical protein
MQNANSYRKYVFPNEYVHFTYFNFVWSSLKDLRMLEFQKIHIIFAKMKNWKIKVICDQQD